METVDNAGTDQFQTLAMASTKKPKQLAKGMGYFNDYNEFGKGRDFGEINFNGDTLKSTREILDGKDCIVSRITDKQGKTRISQIEYPLIYAD